eukprot:2025577-Pleurochrysis_carterae.AAC.3
MPCSQSNGAQLREHPDRPCAGGSQSPRLQSSPIRCGLDAFDLPTAPHEDVKPTTSTGFFGASRYTSAVRARDEANLRQEARATRRKRPSQEEYRQRMLTPAAIQAVITGARVCTNNWTSQGNSVPCHHMLRVQLLSDAVEALTKQRTRFLRLSGKQRAKVVLDTLSYESTGDLHGIWTSPVAQVVYRVGPAPDRMRRVCKYIFLAHFL